jgi:hypothetical protein
LQNLPGRAPSYSQPPNRSNFLPNFDFGAPSRSHPASERSGDPERSRRATHAHLPTRSRQTSERSTPAPTAPPCVPCEALEARARYTAGALSHTHALDRRGLYLPELARRGGQSRRAPSRFLHLGNCSVDPACPVAAKRGLCRSAAEILSEPSEVEGSERTCPEPSRRSEPNGAESNGQKPHAPASSLEPQLVAAQESRSLPVTLSSLPLSYSNLNRDERFGTISCN